MRRRHLLSSLTVGAALSVSGCSSLVVPDTTETTRRQTDERTTTNTASGGDKTSKTSAVPFSKPIRVGETTLEFMTVLVQHACYVQKSRSSIEVRAADGQFLFVGVNVVSGPSPGIGGFDLLVEEEAFPLGNELGGIRPSELPGRVRKLEPYTPLKGAGWIGADLPAPLSGGDAAIRVTADGESQVVALPEEEASALTESPPALSYSTVSAPNAVQRDEPIPVEVTVTNHGEGAGEARSVFNVEFPPSASHMSWPSLQPGESTTISESVTHHQNVDVETEEVHISFYAPGTEYEGVVNIE